MTEQKKLSTEETPEWLRGLDLNTLRQIRAILDATLEADPQGEGLREGRDEVDKLIQEKDPPE